MAQVNVCDGADAVSIEGNQPAVTIAGIVCFFVLLIVGVFALFAREHMAVTAYIAGALAIMGVCLSLIATRRPQGIKQS